jgi:DNA-binding LacI/PurR family transcriptional regulator
MNRPKFSPVRKQLADHLREGISRGRWTETMPGRDRLAREMEINPKTVEAALNLLENEGLLASQGPGRKRKIVLPDSGLAAPLHRIAILQIYPNLGITYIDRLRRTLADIAHEILIVHKPQRIGGLERLVNETPADAWIVVSGSRKLLEWFAGQSLPAFALFGSMRGLPIAGAAPDHLPALQVSMDRLIALGHHRIVLLMREAQRTRPLGRFSTGFLAELEANGIPTGTYNLPDWKDTPDGLRRCLDSLFGMSPPTALIIDEPFLFAAVQQHLARRGILAPEHVSLICIDNDPTFSWAHPSIAHLAWEPEQVLRKVGRWAAKVATGETDRRQSFTKAKFVDGGTIGPVP